MAYYFAAQIKVNDPAGYDKYLDHFDEIFSKYKGEYIAIDESPVILEGTWDYTKSVIIKFNSKKEFEDWYYSDEYQTILKYRLNSAKCDTILLEGME
ncbi:MAG: DUF1330 domain-containing protein [Bacteroidales bacterium]